VDGSFQPPHLSNVHFVQRNLDQELSLMLTAQESRSLLINAVTTLKSPLFFLNDYITSSIDNTLFLKHTLQAMRTYGYEIVQTLIVDIEPDETVKRAMNEINAGKWSPSILTSNPLK